MSTFPPLIPDSEMEIAKDTLQVLRDSEAASLHHIKDKLDGSGVWQGLTPIDFEALSEQALCILITSGHPAIKADSACTLGDKLRTKELKEVSQSTHDILLELLLAPFPFVQLEAAITLAELQDNRATKVLLDGMGERKFRLDAIRALGVMGDPLAITPLKVFLGRRWISWVDKLQAGAALCALGAVSGQHYLVQRLQKSNRKGERAAAIYYIGESNHPEAFTLLSPLMLDVSEPLRGSVAQALAFVSDIRVLQILSKAKESANADLSIDIDHAVRAVHQKISDAAQQLRVSSQRLDVIAQQGVSHSSGRNEGHP